MDKNTLLKNEPNLLEIYWFRFFLVVCSIGLLSFGYVNVFSDQQGYDPLVLRAILAVFCMGIFVFSFYIKLVKKHFFMYLYSFFVAVFVWILFLTWKNHFSINYSVQLIATLLMINLGFFNYRHLGFFICFRLPIVALSLNTINPSNTQLNPLLFIMTLMFADGLSFIVIRIKNKTEIEMQKAKNAAEEANRLKDLVLAKTSHELKTPLNSIVGFSDLLLDSEPEDERCQLLGYIKQSGEALNRMVEEILDVSRIEEGAITLDKQPFALRDTIDLVMMRFRYLIEDKNLTFISHIDEALPQVVIGDALRLEQIMTNLLNNALKYTERGSISLMVYPEIFHNNNMNLNIEISDTGIGIAEDHQKEIFTRFVQVDDSLRRRKAGLGLGLSIVKGFVDVLGGSISVQSQKGTGSTFSVSIPYSLATGMISIPELLADAETKDIKVLLAEDDPAGRSLMEQMFLEKGVTFTIVENGQELIDGYLEKEFNIILTDLHMPEVDGWEAVRIIRASRKFKNNPIPVIALTAFAIPDQRDIYNGQLMDDYYTKPFRKSDLSEILSCWVVKPEKKSEKNLERGMQIA